MRYAPTPAEDVLEAGEGGLGLSEIQYFEKLISQPGL